jgi:hypothetical protein
MYGIKYHLVLLIDCNFGCQIDYRGSDGTEKHAQGKDILIVGSILLLPGAFSCYIYFGAWMKWQGFKYSQVPSLHFDDEPVEE